MKVRITCQATGKKNRKTEHCRTPTQGKKKQTYIPLSNTQTSNTHNYSIFIFQTIEKNSANSSNNAEQAHWRTPLTHSGKPRHIRHGNGTPLYILFELQ
jgi:hypothetical protein